MNEVMFLLSLGWQSIHRVILPTSYTTIVYERGYVFVELWLTESTCCHTTYKLHNCLWKRLCFCWALIDREYTVSYYLQVTQQLFMNEVMFLWCSVSRVHWQCHTAYQVTLLIGSSEMSFHRLVKRVADFYMYHQCYVSQGDPCLSSHKIKFFWRKSMGDLYRLPLSVNQFYSIPGCLHCVRIVGGHDHSLIYQKIVFIKGISRDQRSGDKIPEPSKITS